MHQAHLKAIRLIAERKKDFSHADWTQILTFVGERLTPFLRDMRLTSLLDVAKNVWGVFRWAEPDKAHTRGIFGRLDDGSLWAFTEEGQWIHVTKKVDPKGAEVDVRILPSPAYISEDANVLATIYSEIWHDAGQRRDRLKRSLEKMDMVCGEFETEVALIQAFLLK
jgi:hypothetical protein